MGAHSTELGAWTQRASDQATDSSALQSTVFRIIAGKMYKRIWIFDDRGDPSEIFLVKSKEINASLTSSLPSPLLRVMPCISTFHSLVSLDYASGFITIS